MKTHLAFSPALRIFYREGREKLSILSRRAKCVTPRKVSKSSPPLSLGDFLFDQLRRNEHSAWAKRLPSLTQFQHLEEFIGVGQDLQKRDVQQQLVTVPRVLENNYAVTSSSQGHKVPYHIESFFAVSFHWIVSESRREHGLTYSLSRWDLHHGHVFRTKERQELGVLYHAAEWPKKEELFPYDLGFPQKGSHVSVNDDTFQWRNILQLHDGIWLLDVTGSSPLRKLIREEFLPGNTLLEQDLGTPLADVYYLPQGSNVPRHQRVYFHMYPHLLR